MNLLCNNKLNQIDPKKIKKTHSTLQVKLDLNHPLFSALTPKQKQSLLIFIKTHKILDQNSNRINELHLARKKHSTPPKNTLYTSISLLEKYINIQKQLIESAYILLAKTGLLHNPNLSIQKEIFIDIFSSIHDHEWIYIKTLLDQKINTISLKELIKSILYKFNVCKVEFTKQKLKEYTLKLKNTPIKTSNTTTNLLKTIYTTNKSKYQTQTTQTKLVIDLLANLSTELDQNNHKQLLQSNQKP
jgi:hypothetical protein